MLPKNITAAPLRTVRPRDLDDVYTQPSLQLNRWVRQGEMNKLARGVYYALPDDVTPPWRPTMEAAAAAVATAFFGPGVPVLMHVTAARLHGAVPRAIAVGIVAVPRQEKPMKLTDRDRGSVLFVKRDVAALDAMLMSTELGDVLVTTPEQTVLDLAKRPLLAADPGQTHEAIRQLLTRIDRRKLEDLARQQRGLKALTELVHLEADYRGTRVRT